jgi:hypothetical protein
VSEWEFVSELLERARTDWEERDGGLYQSFKTPPLSEPERERIRVAASDFGVTVTFEVFEGQHFLRTARPRQRKP